MKTTRLSLDQATRILAKHGYAIAEGERVPLGGSTGLMVKGFLVTPPDGAEVMHLDFGGVLDIIRTFPNCN